MILVIMFLVLLVLIAQSAFVYGLLRKIILKTLFYDYIEQVIYVELRVDIFNINQLISKNLDKF
jgi:hypothetical protein